MRRTAIVSLMVGLAGCGGSASRHDANEKFYLIASNIKVPYW